MSFAMDAADLKIWDNAAFNALVADYPAGAKSSLPLQPISTNLLHLPNFSSPYKEKSSKKPERHDMPSIPNDGDVDADIEEVEKEIRRLSLKLGALRIKKAEMDLRASAAAAARRGRIIPAKFMVQKPRPVSKKMEESPARLGRRGLSLGPLEIQGSAGKSCFQKLEGIKEENTPSNPLPCVNRGRTRKSWLQEESSIPSCFRRRGVSLGPSEIASGARFRLPCKLEEEITKKKKAHKSLSVSPRSRKQTISTMSELRKGIATVGAKKPVKKEDSITENLKTKNLFQDIQNPVRKPLKKASMRTVPSRYSLSTARNMEPEKKQRKWSLPEPPENRSLFLGGDSANEEPLLPASSPPSITKVTAMLPKIRTVRNMADSPRDSGCAAKRAAELAGKKTHFSMEGCQDSIVDFTCNFLKFEEH
ncbi:hypothetical protein KSP40_PGU001409 [Platanthera guangdongensis]|uniref:Uncharacterized protein n=1 Tax=Platanthera guangdongensis TaxID=2320717 RepID=A0ABR2MU07_9ASPA